MCGRFVGYRKLAQYLEYFPIDVADAELSPNYNVAPTQEIPVIVRYDDVNHLDKYRWGLVPFWAKDPSIGNRMINARSETAATKPSFRTAFKKRRCLIPADGFYEWKGTKGAKQPMFLTLPDNSPMAFAGLWEIWDDKEKADTPYRSCTILTRQASESVIPIHDRMPVILKPEVYDFWLDPANEDVDSLVGIIQNQVRTELVSVPVSKLVNSAKNNGPENIEPIES